MPVTATHLGTIATLIPGAQISVKQDELTYTLPKTMSKEAALDPLSHPRLGTAVQILGVFLLLKSFDIDLEDGEVATVRYNYVGGSTSQPLEPDPGNGGIVNILAEPRYELDIAMEVVSILRHPRYRGKLTAADQRVIGAMIQMGPLDSSGNSIRRFLSGDTLAEELADKIEAGTTSYEAPVFIWRAIYPAKNTWEIPTSFLGKTDVPFGPVPELEGESDWLLEGCTASGTERSMETSTFTWRSSVVGDSWDADLYT